MKKLTTLVLVVLSFVPVLAFGATFGQGSSYILPADQTTDGNLYAGGATINVLGAVSHDAMVAGGNVLVAGPVSGSVMAGGGSITLTGPVLSDVRLVGGTITLSGPIGGELVAGGGKIDLASSTIVGGDAYIAGNEIVISGGIIGGAKIAGQQVTINGTVGRDVTIQAQKLILGPTAVINGNLAYESAQKAQIASGAQVLGETRYTKVSMPARYSWGNTLALLGLSWLLKLMAVLVTALVIFFILPRPTAVFAGRSTNNFWRELLRGLIVLIVTPVALIILFFSVVGWLIGLVGLVVYLALLLLAGIMSVFTLSGVLSKYAFKNEPSDLSWAKLTLATIVFMALGLIPIVGWLIVLAFFLTALGALSHVAWGLVRGRN